MPEVLEEVKCILLDIGDAFPNPFELLDTPDREISEGTVCPISFVKDTLVRQSCDAKAFFAEQAYKVSYKRQFSYALDALPRVLTEQWSSPDFVPYRDAFPAEARRSPEAFEAHVQDLTRRDVKIAYLKELQGTESLNTPPILVAGGDHRSSPRQPIPPNVVADSNVSGYLWQTGYSTGAYSTPLFDDVVPQLKHWHASSVQLAIYSSGSVFAQKLLFAHVKGHGDLTALITDWYDTANAGPKTEEGSYRRIAMALDLQCKNLLFLSDNVREIEAALAAGMKAIIVDRPGNAPLSDADKKHFEVVDSLHEISFATENRIDARFWKR
ncbi:enolase-phosphatase E1 [Elasticomyces elasticus]|nr:enolase-phosphatase E1 [Elasticomyces elasticus]